MMRQDAKQLNRVEPIGPTDRQTARLDAARALTRRSQALLAAAGMEAPERRWYVLRLASRTENSVDKALEMAGVERWLPLAKFEQQPRRGRKGDVPPPKIVLAWPGYIFVRVADTARSWAGLATLDGVVSVLGTAEHPIPVADEKVCLYKYQLEHDEVARKELSGGLAEGEMVQVEIVRHSRINALVRGIDGDRVSVEVLLFGSMRMVELTLAQVIRSR
jgi:transcriptional antiterminator NusG